MKYTIKNDYLEVKINDFGAELCSLKKVDSDIEYIWQGDPLHWRRHAPILFPIVGKLLDNKYTYGDNTYEMTQHGFARDNEFTIEEQREDFVLFKFSSNEDTIKKYPFEFDLYLGYELDKNTLELSYKVVNRTSGEMIFGIGAHPAFNWPLENGKKEDYYFEFKDISELKTLPISSQGIVEEKEIVKTDGNKLWLSEEVFKNDALVFDDLKVDYVGLKNTVDDHAVEVYFDNFPYVGLWSKPTGAPFICIEPWIGIADFVGHNQKLEEKKGMNLLKESEVFEASYIIKI